MQGFIFSTKVRFPFSLPFLILLLILLLGLVQRVLALTGDSYALVRIVPDDAFYYFKVAVNIVNGKGSTFDGLNLTNGYHPLWMLIILFPATLINDPVVLVKTVLCLEVLLSLLTAILLYRFLKNLTSAWWLPLLGVGLYFLNNQTLANNLNGLETSLTTFLFMLTLYLAVFGLPGAGKTRASLLVFGFSLGLLLLARTDNVFYLPFFFFPALFQSPKKEWLTKGLLIGLPAAILVLPWFAWNWLTFGSFIQTSGQALPYMQQENFKLNNSQSSLDWLATSARVFFKFMTEATPLPFPSLSNALGYHGLLFGPALILALFTNLKRWRQPGTIADKNLYRAIGVTSLLWMGALLLIFTHTFIRWYPRAYYFDHLILLTSLTFCLALTGLTSQISTGLIRLKPLFLLLAVALAVWVFNEGNTRLALGDFPHQTEMLDAAYWLKNNNVENKVAGAFNAGIMGYFSNRPVVNLDGVINNAAFTAIQHKTLLTFMRNLNMGYYLDYDPLMLSLYTPFLGDLENQLSLNTVGEIKRPDVNFENNKIRIYRLSWK